MALILEFDAPGTKTITLPYCPENLAFDDVSAVSALKVVPLGKGTTFDLSTAANVTAVAQMGKQGGTSKSRIELADGVLKSTNTDITVTATGPCLVYAGSTKDATMLFSVQQQKCLESSNTPFEGFLAVLFPAANDADNLSVNGIGGFQDTIRVEELSAWNTENQVNDMPIAYGTDFASVIMQSPSADNVAVYIKPILL